MPLAIINGRVLYFAHIPKTGGTSVETYLRQKGKLALWSPKRTSWSRTTPQHMLARTAQHYVPPECYDHGFAVLRDPLDRLKSEFRMAAREAASASSGGPWTAVTAMLGRVRRRQAFRIRMGRLILVLDFDTWVRLGLLRAARDPYAYGAHFTPQVQFLDNDMTLFRLEDGLDPVYRWIDRVTETEPASLAPYENKGAVIDFEVSSKTEALVRRTFGEDYDLLDRLVRDAPRPV